MFLQKEINVGDIVEGKQVIIDFPYNSINIVSITSPCDCSIPRNREKDQIIRVTYTPKSVVPQLREVGYQDITKRIIVKYKSIPDHGELLEQELIFTARVYIK